MTNLSLSETCFLSMAQMFSLWRQSRSWSSCFKAFIFAIILSLCTLNSSNDASFPPEEEQKLLLNCYFTSLHSSFTLFHLASNRYIDAGFVYRAPNSLKLCDLSFPDIRF